MEIYKTIPDVKDHLKHLRNDGFSLGFVPTMGALHEGHISLINKAGQESDIVVCSIFVNPIQFNNKKDLDKYPRTIEKDIEILKLNGCDILFLPDVDEMYPEPDNTVFDFGQLDKILEGKFRPGHFNGVAIVVKKLFEIIEAEKAYFGEKDFQQLAIINALVKDYHIPVQIVPCHTVREEDGLAMSSRNQRLTKKERAIAPEIYRILKQAKEMATGKSTVEVREWVLLEFKKHPEFKPEYFEIVDPVTFNFDDKPFPGKRYIALVAVFLGEIRLIDNIEIFF
jgi:pantoate--beta-alanine ligase